MSNHNDDSKKIALGLMIGTMIGAGALYCISASRHRQMPILHQVGRTLTEVGHMLENSRIESLSDVAHEVQNAFPKGTDMMSTLMNWLSSGINLWKKIKHGG